MKYWMAKGPPDNWKLSLQKGNIWGVTERYRKAWNDIQIGDGILLYAMTPVKGLIGYGKVTRKFADKKPFWSAEFKEGNALWPLRLSFTISLLVPEEEWEQKAIMVPPHQSARQRSIHRVDNEVANSFVKSLEKVITSRT